MTDITEIAGELIREDPALADAVLQKLSASAHQNTQIDRDHLERMSLAHAKHYPEWRLPLAICSSGVARVSAKRLMISMGLPFHGDPVGSFVSLCNSYLKINRVLPIYGWQVKRTGGTPDAVYSLGLISDE